MKKVSGFIGKFMALIVLAIAALALFVPQSCLWINTGWINYLLMIIMFGMGLTMKLSDFAIVFRQPRKKAVAIEIGMQNSGLATTLAGSAFPDLVMATVPGAIFLRVA